MAQEELSEERRPALRQNQPASAVWVSDMLRPLVQSRHKQDSSISCHAPRRLLEMLLLGLVVPLALVGAALNARLVLYTPQTLATAPTDQRLLRDGISSFWCQGQSVTMNGSFNAFLVKSAPKVAPHRPRHSLQRGLRLIDDVKEYWGFHLHRGSTISLRACARFEGGQLMILRGLSNLHRCAWIGRRDSAESGELSDERTNSQASNPLPGEEVTDNFVHLMRTIWKRVGSTSGPNTDNYTHQSNERVTKIDNLLKKAINLSKDRMEIMHSLYKQANSIFTGATTGIMPSITERTMEDTSSEIKNQRLENISQSSHTNSSDVFQINSTKNISDATISLKINMKPVNKHGDREERSVDVREDRDGAFEEFDKAVDNKPDESRNRLAEFLLADPAFTGDSSEGNGDFSESSSEEALAKCEGILLNEDMEPSIQCSEALGRESIQLTYDIPATDTYYFIFSSDNEIVANLIYLNLTLDRAVYDTSDAKQKCLGVESCSLPIEFLSDDLVVVSALSPGNPNGDESYVLNSECEPRVPIYLTLILVVPIFIITCASR